MDSYKIMKRIFLNQLSTVYFYTNPKNRTPTLKIHGHVGKRYMLMQIAVCIVGK